MTMHGFLNIDKPAGMTSHDVVARMRRAARQKRVGHAGTLDPAATGVLVVGLGAATTTDDAEGEVLLTAPVPDLDAVEIERALNQFRGAIEQVPPMYAALHHEGRR